MKRILICADDMVVESLLVVVVEHMGHETDTLRFTPHDAPVAGDLLLVDPTAPHAVAWARALRHLDPAIPVVAVGLSPVDPDSLGFAPTTVIPKPFSLDELRDAVEQSLRRR